MSRLTSACAVILMVLSTAVARGEDNIPPEGFQPLFNGKTFAGWHGMGHFDPRELKKMSPAALDRKRTLDDQDLLMHWKIEGGELINDGHGVYLTTDREFSDFELLVDYKMLPKGDSGIYLKANPQVQIWDYTDPEKFPLGANKGSGGLWNNSPGAAGKDPLVLADRPFGEWNHFRVIQVGGRTTVYLNDKLVVDHAIHENYFDRAAPLFARGPIQLQTHGSEIRWKNVFIREIPSSEANEMLSKKGEEGFTSLFNGKDLEGWAGAVANYEVKDGAVMCKQGQGGVLHSRDEYGDFVVRLEIKLPPGGNNGLAIRYPGSGDCAYVGMCELQVLDNESPKYATLDPRQYHGSAYGMVPAARGFQRPTGEWNFQEVTVQGSKIRVELNGNLILNTDLGPVKEFMANSPHPGKDLKKGFFGFAGHGDAVMFRNVRIKALPPAEPAKVEAEKK